MFGARLRNALGMKVKRMKCGAETGLGWPCQCRSRHHVLASPSELGSAGAGESVRGGSHS